MSKTKLATILTSCGAAALVFGLVATPGFAADND